MDPEGNVAAPRHAPITDFLGAKVVLAVSTFRNDDEVLRILDAAHAAGDHPFVRIVVVDSLGTGRIPSALRERSYRRVHYHSFDRNVGAAGNLLERLRVSADAGADYAYALNHDGFVDIDAIGGLVRFARDIPRLGAVYPARRYISKGGALDLAGARNDLLGTLFSRRKDAFEGALPVHWSSSNGALYSLEPVRNGVLPWADLWMGYEDLEYGWSLEAAGYAQYLLGEVVVDDDYQYRLHRLGPIAFHVSDKPAWYAYYHARNLVLASRRHRRGAVAVAGRLAVELALTAAVRPEKATRARLLARGLADGLRGVVGKWELP